MGSRVRTSLTFVEADLPLTAPFRIAGRAFTSIPVVVARLERAGLWGRGEAAGVYYLDDDPPRMRASLEAVRGEVEAGLDRAALQRALPPGGARNALDCAFWELEAREARRPVWDLAGLEPPHRLLTTLTLGAEPPDVMAAGARGVYADARALKLKLTGEIDLDIERVRAVRAARPDVWIGVDANQAYAPAALANLLPTLADCGVALLEQPFPRGEEAWMDGLDLPLPVAADESCQGLAELEALAGRFEVVNIKLDKCGGLTEGLAMARRAQALGLKVMVGNMVGSSLSVGPAFVLGQLCDVVDLDGPTFLRDDPAPRAAYVDGYVECPPAVWGFDPAIPTVANLDVENARRP